MATVEVKTKGIKNRLKSVKPYKAIAEYIWNGFDAKADTIEINYETDPLGTVTDLEIKDNGDGIAYEEFEKKFKPVLSSEKRDEEESTSSLTHGRNGLGRLTFYHFAQAANWETHYKSEKEILSYNITVDADALNNYSRTRWTKSEKRETGTTASFKNIQNLSETYMKNELIRYLIKEFCWFLELKKNNGFSIHINGTPLEYDSIIKDREELKIITERNSFRVQYIQWSSKLNRHFSRFYCSDLEGRFKHSQPTTLNNKGDEFYHSVYVEGEYFNNFTHSKKENHDDLISSSNQSTEFKELIAKINSHLRSKRKPYIVNHAKKLADDFERDGYFPRFNEANAWEKLRHNDLKETIIQLYQAEPRIFSNLNSVQKKTIIGFIALAVDAGEVGDLLEILDSVISLTTSEREKFARQLKTAKLSSIINTIELISDRYKSVAEFKSLVFDPTMYAGEVPHLQKMMEKNYWLIGEEYTLLTAAEPKFEEALRRHTHLLKNQTNEQSSANGRITHEHKNKEMDLFLVRQGKRQDTIENIVLELKHPRNVRIGKKEFDQIYNYFQVISSIDQFNASNMTWKFYLIGNQFDSTGYIESQIGSHKIHGEPGLIFSGPYKVYAFKWSEIFNEFELKHDFLNKNLKLELERASENEHDSADDIVARARSSDAPKEYSETKVAP